MQANLEEAERLSGIVEALLFLASASPQSIAKKPLDVAAELALIDEFFQVSAEQASVSLRTTAAAGLTILADRTLFQRAISNLVSNALSHTPAGGAVTIAARAGDGGVAITVRDTGEGIPEADQARVFERFYRVRHEGASGRMGLGLPIAKTIVEAHGGAITLQSKPGEGAAITLTFPAAPAQPAASETAAFAN